jgi:HEAT repeat protein
MTRTLAGLAIFPAALAFQTETPRGNLSAIPWEVRRHIINLYSEDEIIRGRAALSLGNSGSQAAVRYLVGLLGDSGQVRRVTSFFGGVDPGFGGNVTIGEIAAEALLDLGAERELWKALYDDDDTTAASAAAALTQRPGAAPWTRLAGMLDDPDPEFRRRIAALFAPEPVGDPDLDTRPEFRPAVPALLPYLKDAEREVRESIARALELARDPRAVPALAAALEDSSEAVRFRAAVALGVLRDSRALAPLAAALRDDEGTRSMEASYTLAHMGRAGSEALFQAFKDPDSDVRSAAVNGLSELAKTDAAALAALIACLQDEAGQRLRETCGGSLRDVKPAVTPLIGLLRSPRAETRALAADVLGDTGERRAVPALIDALGDSDAKVREEAAESLGFITEQEFGEDAARWRKWWASQRPPAAKPAVKAK